MHLCAHCSIIYNNQDMEKVSVLQCTNGVYIYNYMYYNMCIIMDYNG